MSVTHQPGESLFGAIRAEDIEWKPFAAFPPGARLAVLVGDPKQAGPLRHPRAAPGRRQDDAAQACGGPHLLGTLRGVLHRAGPEYITQVSAIGPLGLSYVHPSDDPRL
jgi:hypothetical protein